MARFRLLFWLLLCSAFVTLTVFFKRGLGIPLRSSSFRTDGDTRGHNRILDLALAEVAKSQNAQLKKRQQQGEEKVLTDAFVRCDADHSSSLSLQEAVDCISHQVTLHLTRALRENFFYFTAVDQNPRNGVISWDEYIRHYLQKEGYDKAFIESHLDNLKGLKRQQKESIMRDKASWAEAARTDSDYLTLDEFLAFRHPESSHANILAKVEEILYSRDVDEDGSLTKEEFLEDGEMPEEQFMEMDENSDGKVERREMLKYLDPRHPHHSRLEAELLFSQADSNGDQSLSLEELLAQASLFASSKLVDAGLSFHSEF